MKHGCGLIVTLDGIYYEGVFMQDVLTVSATKNIKNSTLQSQKTKIKWLLL